MRTSLREEAGADASPAPSTWRRPRSRRPGVPARPRRRATTASRPRRPRRRTRRHRLSGVRARAEQLAGRALVRVARRRGRRRARCARAAATTASPIEPPPITSTRSPGSASTRPTAWAPTASGSTSAPIAGSMPSGSGTRQLRSTITSSARPPSTRHAVQPVAAGAAELGLAREAAVAGAAPHVGLHRDRRAVVEHARELVAEGDRQVPRRQVEIGRADAARPHAHPHRIDRVRGRRRFDGDDRDTPVARRPHRSHGRESCRRARQGRSGPRPS